MKEKEEKEGQAVSEKEQETAGQQCDAETKAQAKPEISDEKLEIEPVNMYILFARLFADITREVEKKFGEEGVEAVREGVRQFGLKRGRDIARRAKAMGHDVTPEFYLSCYDMGRSNFFDSDDRVTPEEVEQTFSKCVFADTWTKDGDQKYGIHYCQMIDPAIAEGYSRDFVCVHDKHFFKDGCCHFHFFKQDAADQTNADGKDEQK